MSDNAPGCNSYIAELEGIKRLLEMEGPIAPVVIPGHQLPVIDGDNEEPWEIKISMIDKEIESIQAIYNDYDLVYRREHFLKALAAVGA